MELPLSRKFTVPVGAPAFAMTLTVNVTVSPAPVVYFDESMVLEIDAVPMTGAVEVGVGLIGNPVEGLVIR